jgi:hypothetical protein
MTKKEKQDKTSVEKGSRRSFLKTAAVVADKERIPPDFTCF